MDPIRFGLTIRALRRRRRWTQAELALHARCSRSAIARIERGESQRCTVQLLERILAALDARLVMRVLWHGEELDRLLDAEHARLVEVIADQLSSAGWQVHVEVTFQIRGERGSIDVLALHPARSQVLVIEVKSVVPDVQAMLSTLDRKVRLAPTIVRDRGWTPEGSGAASRILVLPADRTARRRIDRHRTMFERALPARTIEVRRWLAEPSGSIAGIMFVSGVTQAGARQRIAARQSPVERGRARESGQMRRGADR